MKKLTAKELNELNEKAFAFEGEWEDFVGKPAEKGVWIVWGKSFQGKTSFCIRLVKYLASLGKKIAYVSLEEGAGKSIQRAWQRENMVSENARVSLWSELTVEELKEELRKQRSPNVVVIDSLQYLGINYAGYKALKEEFKSKLFIFVSQATEQKEPMGTTAVKVRYDAGVKIMVDGFIATGNSRYGGGKPMIIWEKGVMDNTAKKTEDYERKRENYKFKRQMAEESDSSDFRIPIIDARREVLRRWGFGESGESESSCESCCGEGGIQQDTEDEVDSNI